MRRRAGCRLCARRSPPIMGAIRGSSCSADNICVTSGATEALAAAILATVEPGDEVIVFTPAYDAYVPLIRRAGGAVRSKCALQPPGWRIERAALEAAVSPRTRAIIFNNPHNPTGRLFDRDELAVDRRICARSTTSSSSRDEVWEHILLDGQALHADCVAARHGRSGR